MKISNVVLASMVSASCIISCKNEPKTKTKAEIEKIKQDSIKKAEADTLANAQNCPACGMG